MEFPGFQTAPCPASCALHLHGLLARVEVTELGMEIRLEICFFNRTGLDPPLYSYWMSLREGPGVGDRRHKGGSFFLPRTQA